MPSAAQNGGAPRTRRFPVQKDYYWLAQQCFVRYDAKQDVLLVSGERYDGEQPLRHVKDEKKAR
jgi:hypothetical protein